MKERAIQLREKGLSYSEILKQLPVAKSTLSLWLRSVDLHESSKLRLIKRQTEAQNLGGKVKRKQRKERTKKIKRLARSQIVAISKENLFLMGVMLYWAEGSKEKESNIGQQVTFTNSDPLMCRLFLKWARICLEITDDRITPSVYIHQSQRGRSETALKFWSKEIGIPERKFGNTCFTHTKLSKRNKVKYNEKYYGQLRIRIKKSVDLNRRITGWIQGVCVQCGVE